MSQEIEEIRAEAIKLKEVLEASLRSPALSESKTTPEQRIEAAKNGMKNLREATNVLIALTESLQLVRNGVPVTAGWCFAAGGFLFCVAWLLFVNWAMGVFS